jgi:hypothetical protein
MQPGVFDKPVGAKVRAERSSIFKQPFGSEGTIENSPALKCRDRLRKRRVPQGRLKRKAFFQASLRDWL